MKPSRRPRQWMVAIFLIAGVFLAVNGFLTYQSAQSLVAHDNDVIHTQSILARLQIMLTAVDDAESGQRGYILTGEASYLKPYTGAQDQITRQQARLTTLLVDDPTYLARLDVLQRLIAQKMIELQTTLNLYQSGNHQQALDLISSGQGLLIMDQIRQQFTSMQTDLRSLLTQRNAQAQDQLKETLTTDIIASIANVTLIIVVFVLSRRALRQRERVAAQQEVLLERESLSRQQAEEAVLVRNRFLAIAAHEIKTPLTALLTSWQVVQRRQAREANPDERQRQQWTLIQEQMQRLRSLTEIVFDISRLDTSALAIRHDPIDVTAIVEHTVAMVEATTERHRFVIDIEESPLVVLGEAVRVDQVISNLLQNAVKYSPFGGTITTRVSCDAGEVHISISDNGIGIPASDLPHLYERFYRASNADPEHINGLGIGLYIVQEIVTLHGGVITVTSTEGKGSCFSIHLPLSSEDLGVPVSQPQDALAL